MGKGLLILVLGSTIVLSQMSGYMVEVGFASDIVNTEYEERVLARELAHSAFNLLVSRVIRNFSTYRDEIGERAYGDGMYSLSATGERKGPITLTAFGEVGSAVHRIDALLERFGDPMLDAITVDGPLTSVTALGSSFVISGIDHPASDTDVEGGYGPDGHAIKTVLQSARSAMLDSISPDQLVGVNGVGDVAYGDSNIDLDTLQSAIQDHPDLIHLEGDQIIAGNKVYGSPANPVVMSIGGDLDVSGNVEGYGILLVLGSIKTPGTFRWEGLVMLVADGGDHQFEGTVDIIGALVMRSLTAAGESGGYEDAGLLGGHFDVDVFSGANELKYHQHQYDDRFDREGLNFLQPGCDTDGGLCWDESVITLGYTDIRVELTNTGAAAGVFILETVDVLIQGPISTGLLYDLSTSDLLTLSVQFDTSCGLLGLSPDDVASDALTRGGSLTLRVYDTTPEIAGNDAVLIHEVSAYRHSENPYCTGAAEDHVDVMPISFYINGNVGIHQSNSALKKVDELLPVIQPEPVEIKMSAVKENSVRSSILP